jgi:hypothetical protein
VHRLLKSYVGQLWPLAFLLLPGCGLNAEGFDCREHPESDICKPDPREVTHFKPGTSDRHTAIFCDIPNMNFGTFPTGRRCATDDEKSGDPSLWGAAMALVAEDFPLDDGIGVDTSDDAVSQLSCSSGGVAIGFKGAFPDGTLACVSHTGNTLGNGYGNVAEACVDLCWDLNKFTDVEDGEIQDFCQANARPSTNANQPFDDACDDSDALLDSFKDNDPRRKTEPVSWAFTTSGAQPDAGEPNTLKRTANTTGAFTFDEGGAATGQLIDHGDGFVEVTATPGGNRLFGLSTSVNNSNTPTSADLVDFVDLASNNGMYIFADGEQQTGDETGAIAGAFAAYQDGDRVRIQFTANPDGTTARIDFYLLPQGTCQGVAVDAFCALPAGTTPLFTIASATYPFRVDGWMDTKDDTLTGARMVRIKK